MKTLICIVGAMFVAFGQVASSAESRTEHTFQLQDGESRPSADLSDAAWLAGSWSGTAFGAKFEEVWNPPSVGSMVGFFKLYADDGVRFYEILLMTVEEGTLSLKVKHFNPDFSAWEEKPDYVNFRLVKKTPDALHFGGISFYKRGDNSIDAYIVMRSGEELREHHLKYERRPHAATIASPPSHSMSTGEKAGESE